jgi:hypothetical protein
MKAGFSSFLSTAQYNTQLTVLSKILIILEKGLFIEECLFSGGGAM